MLEYKQNIYIDDHVYERPPLPPEEEIWFINESTENAYWRRDTNYPEIWYDFLPYETKMDADVTLYDNETNTLASLSVEDSNIIRGIYEQEVKRRTQGVHFRNGDEIEYITGDHYFVLQWCQMTTVDNQKYPSYREFQRDFFYLVEIAIKNRHILGATISKAKKTGITNLVWLLILNRATLYKNQNFAAININKTQAVNTFKAYFLYSYTRLPSALKPQEKSFAPQDGTISFGNKFNTSKKKKGSAESDELNTTVMCLATDPHAPDILKFNIVWVDELPKIDGSPAEMLRVQSQALKLGNFKNGIFLATSYTPDEDTSSFKEARQMFWDAELSTITPNSRGKTRNELINWHISATKSWIGEYNDCFDRYGKCNELKALQEIEYDRERVKDNPKDLQALTRQYAITKKEAWASAGAGSIFDNIRLGDLLSDVQEEMRNTAGNLYIDGKFEWVGKPLWETSKRNRRPRGEFAPVKFVPLSEEEKAVGKKGRVRFYDTIPPQDKNCALTRGFDTYGNLLLPREVMYVGGADPTEQAAASEVIQGSKNGSYTMNLPDEIRDTQERRIASNIILTEYFYRPENPQDFYEDLVKEIIYFGKVFIVEANKKWVATQLIEDGLGRYMLVRNKETGVICLWEPDLEYTLIQTTASGGNKDMIDTFVRLMKNYFQEVPEGEKDYGRTIKSDRLLNQLMDLDGDTKKFDLFMAWGYTLLALECYLAIKRTPKDTYVSDYRQVLAAFNSKL